VEYSFLAVRRTLEFWYVCQNSSFFDAREVLAVFDATGQTAMEGLIGRSAGDIVRLSLPRDNYHVRVHVCASILCESREGSSWKFDSMDRQGRTLWTASEGKGRCNVDPASKKIVRG